jgi:dsDNA-specific endonuclease/ATPase MutS2
LLTLTFGELKALKYQDDRLKDASVAFDEESYRYLSFVVGMSCRSMLDALPRRLG